MSERTSGTAPLPAVTSPIPPAAMPLHDVEVTGLFDAAAMLKLREQVTEALADGPVTMLVDISGVTQVTASGLAGMLELLRLARSRGGDVRLYGISLAVADAQEASRLTSVTRIYVRRDQAAQSGAQPPTLANPARSKRGPVGALRSISGGRSGSGVAPAQAQPSAATPQSGRAVVGGADR